MIPKEFAILELLLRNQGKLFCSEQIVAQVWHADANASPEVVRGSYKKSQKKA